MCGIVAYLGDREAYPILVNGLKRLEYRGYDSAGISLIMNGDISTYKCAGKVSDLENHINGAKLEANIGMGHTRWATHGPPNHVNAHPHVCNNGNLAIIHNGIIENYLVLKEELLNKGYTFQSETDSEVLITFISDVWKHQQGPLEEAVRIALNMVVGAYGIVILDRDNPDQLIAVRKSSPLVIGVGKDEYFVASDASPFIEYTNEVIYLKDDEIAIIKRDELSIVDYHNIQQENYVQKLDLELEAIEKAGFEHFMLKEIYEQPKSVRDCLRGRINTEKLNVHLGGIHDKSKELYRAERIIVTACGTSFYSGLVAEYIIEELCRIPVEVEYASEFRYRNPIIRDGDVVIGISQSGETADTLTAILLAQKLGAPAYGICNVVASSIARATDAGVYTHAGPEIGVASTKAFTAQLAVLSMIALKIANYKGTISHDKYSKLVLELSRIPGLIEKVLLADTQIQSIAATYMHAPNFLYLGRGINYPVAMEGALKLKEISYIHAEGYPAAEMKHGPIALIDENMPVVVIATKDSAYDKIVSNIQEVKARKGKVIAIATEGDTLLPDMVDHCIFVPDCNQYLSAMITVIPLQLLAYHIGVMKGCNVDQPRNLAKSVTVE